MTPLPRMHPTGNTVEVVHKLRSSISYLFVQVHEKHCSNIGHTCGECVQPSVMYVLLIDSDVLLIDSDVLLIGSNVLLNIPVMQLYRNIGF